MRKRVSRQRQPGQIDVSGACESIMWRHVLVSAGMDAINNINKTPQEDAAWHYEWSKGWYCEWICQAAYVDWDCIKAGFERIYKEVGSQGEYYKGARELQQLKDEFKMLLENKQIKNEREF